MNLSMTPTPLPPQDKFFTTCFPAWSLSRAHPAFLLPHVVQALLSSSLRGTQRGQREGQAQASRSILGQGMRAGVAVLCWWVMGRRLCLAGGGFLLTPDLGTRHVLGQRLKDPWTLPVFHELGWQALGS